MSDRTPARWVDGEMPARSFIGDAAREVVVATGPDAIDYLHGQLSQDVVGLIDGATTWSFLLEPNGKVLGHLRLTRIDGETFVIDVDAGSRDAVRSSLDRFKLRTRIELTVVDRRVLGLRGEAAVALADTVAGPDGLVVPTMWPDPAVDVVLPEGLGTGRDIGAVVSELIGDTTATVDVVDAAAWESARVRAGVPRVGMDVDGSTIPAESGLVPASVSFTKGCYRGQELVERIESRGAVRRELRSLIAEGPVAIGDSLRLEGRDVGVVTSATSGIRVPVVALGYVRTEAQAGAVLESPSGTSIRVSAPV